LGADLVLAATGIAGPGGGLPHKPVGTTWIGLIAGEQEWAREFHFAGNRLENKEAAAVEGLRLLLSYLEGNLM